MPANYEQLADSKTWVRGVYVLLGFVAPEFIRKAVEENSDTDLPNEVYGLLVGGVAVSFASGSMKNYTLAGSSVYVVLKLLERFDIIEPIVIQQKAG